MYKRCEGYRYSVLIIETTEGTPNPNPNPNPRFNPNPNPNPNPRCCFRWYCNT